MFIIFMHKLECILIFECIVLLPLKKVTTNINAFCPPLFLYLDYDFLFVLYFSSKGFWSGTSVGGARAWS